MSWEIVPPGTNIDFIGKRRLCALLSVALLVASLLAIPIRGVRLGIDFAGGSEIQVKFDPGVPVDEGGIREIVGGMPGIENLSVVRYGDASTNEFLIRFLGNIEPVVNAEVVASEALEAEDDLAAGKGEISGNDRIETIREALVEGVGGLTVQRVEFVGPRVGAELRNDGMMALLWASLAILIYIAFRFSSRFAPGAIVAVLHDLSITAGIFVLLGLEFDLKILAAMLAILGYSLNDTIIIYDRIRENMAIRTKVDLPDVLNESVNQTLSRTVLTSGTTLVVLLCLFFLGGEVIRPFAFAMLIGVLVGTYSSIFIASPLLLFLEQRLGDTPAPSTPAKAGHSEREGKGSKGGKRAKTRAARA